MSGAVLLVALLGLFQGAIGVQIELEPLLNATSEWEYRLLENAYVINNLEKHIERLTEKLKTKPVDVESIYRKTENAVNRLEGTGCADHELQCGSIERECVSKLLICDGVKDCVNGHDEDPSYCDVSKIRAGVSFSGWFTEGTCRDGSSRNLYFCRMRVSSVKRSSIFRSFLPMTMTSTCTRTVMGLSAAEQAALPPIKLSYSVSGNYQIANRRWFSESGIYSSICQFPDDSFQEMRCDTYIGSTDRCNTGQVAYRDD